MTTAVPNLPHYINYAYCVSTIYLPLTGILQLKGFLCFTKLASFCWDKWEDQF